MRTAWLAVIAGGADALCDWARAKLGSRIKVVIAISSTIRRNSAGRSARRNTRKESSCPVQFVGVTPAPAYQAARRAINGFPGRMAGEASVKAAARDEAHGVARSARGWRADEARQVPRRVAHGRLPGRLVCGGARIGIAKLVRPLRRDRHEGAALGALPIGQRHIG